MSGSAGVTHSESFLHETKNHLPNFHRMNSSNPISGKPKNPTMPVLKLALAVTVPWCAGFLMGGGSVVNKSLDGGAQPEAMPSHALSADLPRAGDESREVSPAERRERVLAALRATMRLSDSERRMGGDASVVLKIGPEDIQAAIELVLKEGSDSPWSLLPQIVARWGDFDPKAAADYALTLKPGENWSRESLLTCLTTQWAGKNPAAAKAWALAMPMGKEQEAALDGVIDGMLQADPAATLAWVKTLPDELRPARAYSKIFEKWAERDPFAASPQALALLPGRTREHALNTVATYVAAKDPHAALDLLQQVPDSLPGYLDAVMHVFQNLAAKDSDEAVAVAISMKVDSGREFALGTLLSKAAQKGDKELARLLEKLPDEKNRIAALETAAWSISYTDAETAKKLALMLPAGKTRDESIVWVAEHIAPANGVAFLENHLAEGESKRDVVDRALWKWAVEDPHEALMWMMKSPGANAETLQYAIDQWAHEDPAAALELANLEPDGERKNILLSGAIKGLSFGDPRQAVELLARIPPGKMQADAAHRIAGAWAPHDPIGAAEWAVQIPDRASREAAMVRVTQAMVHTDIASTAAWLDKLRVGGERDVSVAAFAESVTSRDPESAVAWAATVADDRKREEAFCAVYRQWKANDAAAANRWLGATAALSAEAKKRIGPE